MLTKNQLIELSSIRGLKPYQQEKHYIQTAILIALSDYQLVFKGGTYLWFFHGLDRYSTDLDFTIASSENKNIDELSKDMMKKIKNKLKLLDDIDCDCKLNSLMKGIGFSIKVNVIGPLYTTPKSICYVDVDLSLRERVILNPTPCTLDFPAYNFPVVIVSGMDLQEVLAEKVRAIMTRNSARDVYDLWFILEKKGIKMTSEIYNIIEQKLKYSKLTFDFAKFKKKLKEKESDFKNLDQMIFRKLEHFDYYCDFIIKNLKVIKDKQ